MTPEDFVRHWHAVAKIAPPRFFPDGWLRQADVLMRKGITAEDLSVVAGWMRSQMARSQNREQNSVAFNAASFGWVKMFGEFGASNQHETFIARLTLAEAARKPAGAAGGAQKAEAAPVRPVDAVEEERIKRANAAAFAEFQKRMQGGGR